MQEPRINTLFFHGTLFIHKNLTILKAPKRFIGYVFTVHRIKIVIPVFILRYAVQPPAAV